MIGHPWLRRHEAVPRLRLIAAQLALALAVPARTAAQPVGEMIGAGIARFHASESARAAAPPSLALERPWPAAGPVDSAFRIRPRWGRALGYRVARIPIPPGTSLYGTGETPGRLLRNGRRTAMWNFDAYAYGDSTPHLYQSHPWVLAVRPDGSAFGVLFDTSHRGTLDLTSDIAYVAHGPDFPVIVVERPSPQDVVSALADLTGRMPLPPRWALGYHQCRFSYTPESRVREVAREFRSRRIPCDVLWMDIDYMHGFRCFTFDPRAFPDPTALNDTLHQHGFRSVWMIDPGIKREPGYGVYDSGTALGAWVRDAGGRDYVGRVWPGECVFPDFLNRRVREWWSGLYAGFLAHGIDGVWNDMNEPAVFGPDSKTMPTSNRHDADADLGGPGDHARYHNVYGMQMVRATREGALAARPDRRPFVLSRANFLGGHRYAATWTGDNVANWYHLDASIPMALNLGLSGQPFAGPDIGGFKDDGDGPLFARWIGIGALLPFARGHASNDTRPKEPWAFGPEVEATARTALERRYRLLPYLYTLFREASVEGLPVMRPLFFADPGDPALRAEDDAFLLGRDLLVVAETTPRGSRTPALPRGTWRTLDLGLGESANRDLPVLRVRGGAILPLGPVVQHVDEAPLDPLTLVVVLEGGRAEGVLYEDAGDGYDYQRGGFRVTRYEARAEDDEVVIRSRVIEGQMPPARRRVIVRVLDQHGERRAEGVEGEELRVGLAGVRR